jgi:hypothetical protein
MDPTGATQPRVTDEHLETAARLLDRVYRAGAQQAHHDLAQALAAAEAHGRQDGQASARVFLHADRCTTEPTDLGAEDRMLRGLLQPGEVAMALRPFPNDNASPALILYGTPDQLRDLAVSGILPFVDDLDDEP